jgi:hypothetical protein
LDKNGLGHILGQFFPQLILSQCSVSAALPRSTSTPGLIESIGKIPLEEMWVSPLPLYPPEKASPESG